MKLFVLACLTSLAALTAVSLSAPAAAPHPIQLCPVAAVKLACPAPNQAVCKVPALAADPVHVVNFGYAAYNTISNSSQVYDCTVNQWVAFSTTGIPLFSQITPPVVPPVAPVTVAKTFSWTAPTQNTDGSAITGALTYNVYVGSAPTNTAPITGTSYVAQLAVGTYSVTVTAVNAAGVESAQSAPALSVTVVATPVVQPNPPSAVTAQ